MKTHFEHLLEIIPDLKKRKVLDLGCGRGKFLIELAKNEVDAVGIETNSVYIETAITKSKEHNVSIKIDKGRGEKLPYNNNEFGFVNMSEVIEHVENPKVVMLEVYRVLKAGGQAYVSVPNRFGIKDEHYHLYFVNWMPRSWSSKFISIFGKHKDYSIPNIGRQKLKEMHYFTYKNAKKFFEETGFKTKDIRFIKITRRFKSTKKFLAILLYKFVRPWYFDSSHLLLDIADKKD